MKSSVRSEKLYIMGLPQGKWRQKGKTGTANIFACFNEQLTEPLAGEDPAISLLR